MTGDVAKNWLRIDGFFIFIDSLVVMSEKSQELWDFFMNYHLISLLIDFVMEKSSPVRIIPKNYSLGTKTNPLDFSVPLKTIAFLLKHVDYFVICRVMGLMGRIMSCQRFLDKGFSI